MKRSEMVELIFKAANQTRCDGVGVTYIQANDILVAMEEAKIKPPACQTTKYGESGVTEIKVFVSDWEPEDDKCCGRGCHE